MKRWIVGWLVVLGCGSGKPAVTVPAPVVAAPPAVVAAPAPPPGLAPPQPTLRLPRNFLPTGYAARLVLDPARDGFAGAIQIAGTVSEPSRVIWLHARKLTIGKAIAQRAGQPDVALTATPRGDDLLELAAPAPLDAGAWTIAIDYTGAYDVTNTTGVFKQTVGGAPYVFSQFEAVYARRAFPCFDEPDNKVPWQLTLDVPAGLVAAGNAPIAAEHPLPDGLRRVELAPTPPLPSYLVAFAVGPFDVVDAGKTGRGTPVRILALAKRGGEAAYAAKTAARVVDLLEDYFAIPYPYAKLDMVTIPITVGFGAMENAGLITYAESIVLMDAKASQERRMHWIGTAAHEIAHQWFGDLVTMAWWDDIWLNEGFATWIGPKIVARFEPAWHAEQGVLSIRDGALDADRLVAARRIRQPIASPDDIFNAFDGITYEKGASILAMFESYVGAAQFQRGVREHLAAHAFANATSADFAQAISRAAGKDLAPAFATFLEQAGAPVVTATVTCAGAAARVALTQHRYVPAGAPAATATQPWAIPVCVAYDRGGQRAETCALLDQPSQELALPGPGCPRWLLSNAGGRGYYRTAYTAAEITALRDEGWAALTWPERRAVFADVREATYGGALPLAAALSLVPRLLAGNDRFTVPTAAGFALGLRRSVPAELEGKYEAWLRQVFGPGARQVGALPRATDSIDAEATRVELLRAAVVRGREPKLLAELEALAERWRDLPQPVRGLVLAVGVDRKPALFDRVLAAVTREPERGRREEMLRALAAVHDPERQRLALALVFDRELDPRESLALFGLAGRRGAFSDDLNLEVAQNYYRQHDGPINERLPHDGTNGALVGLSRLFTGTCRADRRDEIVAYVTQAFAGMPGGRRVVAQGLEQMDQCIARRAVLEPEIRGWLTGVKPAKPAEPAAAPPRARRR